MVKKRRKKQKLRKKLFFAIAFCVILLLLAYMTHRNNEESEENKVIREPVVAGTWYPGTESGLSSTIEEYFSKAKQEELEGIKALIVPHAGYVYSGQVAAQAFNQLQKDYTKVFIIGANHNADAPYFKFSVPEATHYKTPLGEVMVSSITKELLKNDLFKYVPEAHLSHIIEIELPFLQKRLSKFEIIPIVTGYVELGDIIQAAQLISKYLDEDTLIVISSDLSHYHTYEEAVNLDNECIKSVEKQDFQNTAKCEACGLSAILILLEISKEKDWKAKIIDYKNSGDVSGEKTRVVGYSAIAFYQEDISPEDKEFLLKLARETLELYLKDKSKPRADDVPGRLKEKQGCFVTLEKENQLRGCIGHIIPQESLYECVIENAINAAVNDRRFSPVELEELNDIEIEISALSVPEELEFSSSEELLNKLVPLKHGVILLSGLHQSTYLPQVWEQLPEKELFLSQLCIKGGASSDCWEEQSTKIYTYTANVWKETK
ncbi:AmmeMemoRadiSam system protein B [Candidatus Woesearchaeota archaeon]|nr:AmmeMemoRadiSam system protein B [Candidatus Woesearchaeota archaeon]